MNRIRYVAATVALSCAVIATSAMAAENTRSSSPARDDNIMSRQIATELVQNTAVGPYGVRVHARNGYVRLSGSVATIRDWMRADRDARNADGVNEVQNDLSVLVR